MEWHTASSPRPKKARMSKSKIKSMLICFFDSRGIVHTEFVPQRMSFQDFRKHPKECKEHEKTIPVEDFQHCYQKWEQRLH